MSCGKFGDISNPLSNNNGGNGSNPGKNIVADNCDLNSSPFGGGVGSQNNPYLICSPSHLQNINTLATENTPAANQAQKYFQIVTDMDMTNVTYFSLSVFNGTLDGGNHSIKNYSNILPLITVNNGTIQNIKVQNANIQGGTKGAILVGTNQTRGKIINASVQGNLQSSYMTGGICGVNLGTIQESTSTVTINSFYAVGGLCGVNLGMILGSGSEGSVTCNQNYCGGLLGQNINSTTGNNNPNQAPTSGQVIHAFSNASVTGTVDVGGLIGDNQSGTIETSYCAGNIQGTDVVGGLIGLNEDYVTTSTTNGNNQNTSINQPSITNAYSATSLLSSSVNIGGLIGENTSSQGTIDFTYFYGQLSFTPSFQIPPSFTPSLIGTNSGSLTEGNSYFIPQGGTLPSFSNWNFSTIWTQNPNGGPPILL